MKNCLLLFATCLALFSCSSDSKKQEKIPQTIPKIDTIEVIYPWTPKTKEDDVVMCYFDEFGQYSLQPGTNKIPNNVFLENNYVYAMALFPVINFNQKSIKCDSSQGFFQVKTGDVKTDNFINFYTHYRNKIDPMKKFEDVFKSPDWACQKKTFANDLSGQEKVCELGYAKKLNYLSEYAKEYKLDSTEIKQWKDILYYEKISNRLSVVRFANKKWTKDEVESLVKYKADFQRNDYMVSYFRYAFAVENCLQIIRYKATGKLETDPKTDFKLIGDNFKGKTRDLLLTKLMIKINKDKSINAKEVSDYKNQFVNACKTKQYLDYVDKLFVPKDGKITATSLYNLDKKIVDFKDITSKGKVTYVDFWASWCSPCRKEMPDSKKLREDYASKGVEFIYISTDENFVDWERANNQIGLDKNHSFLLTNASDSPLKKQFNIKTIPRYMLINKEGKVIDEDAPRPSDEKQIRAALDKLLK